MRLRERQKECECVAQRDTTHAGVVPGPSLDDLITFSHSSESLATRGNSSFYIVKLSIFVNQS